jgi:opacity protein-like surface antigen
MKHLKIVAACLALSVSGQAFAEESGFYLGAGAGLAHEGFTGFRGDDTAFKLLGGYSINEYLSVEAAYVDGGTQKDDVNGFDVAISSEGFLATLLGKWPVNDVFSPYLKLGYASYDTTATVTGGASTFSDSSSDSDLVFGAGLEFRLGKRFHLRAEGEKIKVSDADYRIYTLIATYHF